MVGSKSGKPGVRMAAGFAYAAGATGILANFFLIAFFALQAGNPEVALPSARPTISLDRLGPR